MKRIALTIMVLGVVCFSFSQANAFDKVNKLGVGIDGGILIPATGDVTSDSSIGYFFDLGPSFGVHVCYGVIPEFSVEAGFKYSFMKMKDEVNDEPSKEPYLNMPQIYVDGILNLGSFMEKENNMINPFVRAGVGIYPWKLTEDDVTGDPVQLDNGEEFKKTSFGLNFGAGLEYFATPELSLFAEGKFHYVFTKDEDKFGPDFDDTGHIGVTAGLTYYFPITTR